MRRPFEGLTQLFPNPTSAAAAATAASVRRKDDGVASCHAVLGTGPFSLHAARPDVLFSMI